MSRRDAWLRRNAQTNFQSPFKGNIELKITGSDKLTELVPTLAKTSSSTGLKQFLYWKDLVPRPGWKIGNIFWK